MPIFVSFHIPEYKFIQATMQEALSRGITTNSYIDHRDLDKQFPGVFKEDGTGTQWLLCSFVSILIFASQPDYV